MSKSKKQDLAAALGASSGIKKINVIPDDTVKKPNADIIYPGWMTPAQAALVLMEEERTLNRVEKRTQLIENYYYKDVLVALPVMFDEFFGGMVKATEMRDRYGEILHSKPRFKVGFDKLGEPIFKEGYAGIFHVQTLDDAIMTITAIDDFQVKIEIELKNKHGKVFGDFVKALRNYLKKNSYVKNNAIRFSSEGMVPMQLKVGNGIFLSSKNENIVSKIIINGLKHKKRASYLFKGPFGTGKTETAFRIAEEALKLGYTFIFVVDEEKFEQAMKYGLHNPKVLIFFEDIDLYFAGSRDKDTNKIMNMLDGDQFKQSEIHILFTTNSSTAIPQSWRRGGRIDQALHFTYLDEESIRKVYEYHTIEASFDGSVDLEKAAKYTIDKIGEIPGCTAKSIADIIVLMSKYDTNTPLDMDAIYAAIDQGHEHQQYMMEDFNPHTDVHVASRTKLVEEIANKITEQNRQMMKQ